MIKRELEMIKKTLAKKGFDVVKETKFDKKNEEIDKTFKRIITGGK